MGSVRFCPTYCAQSRNISGMMKVLATLVTLLLLATSSPLKEVKEVPVAERLTQALEDNPASRVDEEMGLAEISAEAIGDRIMEEMNGAKEKFDVALNRIGEEISKDAAEQNEANIGN